MDSAMIDAIAPSIAKAIENAMAAPTPPAGEEPPTPVVDAEEV